MLCLRLPALKVQSVSASIVPTNLATTSANKSLIGSIHYALLVAAPVLQLGEGLPQRVARMREKDIMTERVVWPTPNTRASSGAMSLPATRYTPATAAPDGEKIHKH